MPWCMIPAIDFVKTKKVGVLRLAVAVALMMQVHMLSCFLLIVSYLSVLFVRFIQISSKRKPLSSKEYKLFTGSLLTTNVWAALIDVGRSNNLVEPFINSKLYIMTVNQRSIQWLINTVTFCYFWCCIIVFFIQTLAPFLIYSCELQQEHFFFFSRSVK